MSNPPLDQGKDLAPGNQVASKTQTARCPLREVIAPQCGLARDYLSGPKGADNSAEDYSKDSIFVTPVRVYFSLGGMQCIPPKEILCMLRCKDQIFIAESNLFIFI